MSASDITLIIISGLGVIHGLFLSIFLWFYSKGNSLSNKILSCLLVVLSFRIGKSVFLEFAENLDVKMIFTGLATIMAIGPLFYLFTKSCTVKSFQFRKISLAQFIPAVLGIGFGLWLEESHLETLPLWFFASLFATYYLHFVGYLIVSIRYIRKQKELMSQDVYKLLTLLYYSLFAIWVVYVLNLFDENVPYIVGPILYSIVAYVVSFIVIQNGYIERIDKTKYKTTPVSEEQLENIFSRTLNIIEGESQYKNSEITLKSLSGELHVSTQVLSMAVNQKSKMNFNSFINSYRIKEASRLFENEAHSHLTVAAIAFEVGFNSISSFNTAFKKQIGLTPQAYRKQSTK
jgi:AraC-like DNA-binding protein